MSSDDFYLAFPLPSNEDTRMMPPSSLVWKSDLARIKRFLHLSYGRLLGIPPHTSQFTTMEYGGTYRLKQNFTLHFITTFWIDAAYMQSN